MKTIVCGGRNFTDVDFAVTHLVDLHNEFNFTEIIEGGATGADSIGRMFGEEMGIPVTSMPADWNRLGMSAGMVRNREMLACNPDMVIAFPGGNGTANMCRIAEEGGYPLWKSERLYFKKECPQYGFLSNFALGYEFVDSDGCIWATTEHYYQAMKSPVEEERGFVQMSKTPGEAKKRGNQINIYKDWDNRKEGVMMDCLRMKFAEGTKAAQMLQETEVQYLIEYAPWGDTYWGVDRSHKGLNRLGVLLMKRRDELMGISLDD